MTEKYSLKVSVSDTRREMGIEAGRCGERLILEALSKKETARIIFASAPSQDDVLSYLRESRKIDWSRIEAFHMDEYTGLPEGAPQSFSSYLERTLFSSVHVKAFHKLVPERGREEEACREYARLLREAPIDIVFLGIGENGHVAFNDPWMADLLDTETVKLVKLDGVCRMQQVHDGAFPAIDDVPVMAATLTVPALMRGEHLVCTVPTAAKNEAVKKLLFGPVSVDCPATAMRRHPDANIFLDSSSGEGISTFSGVKTSF